MVIPLKPRTDLAVEKLEETNQKVIGIKNECYFKANIEFTKLKVLSEDASKIIGKPIGEYLTAEIPDIAENTSDFDILSKALACEISSFLPCKFQSALLIGLGNRDITPDALGPKTAENILATRHIPFEKTGCLRRVAVLSPGVLGQTGIESGEIIKSLCEYINPDVVIAVDSFAAKSTCRLFKTVQISNSGITPGSGVGNSRFEISLKTLGKPVIAIGMPTVSTEFFKENEPEMIVTPSDIDKLIKNSSKLLGLSLNRALQPDIPFDFLQSLA